MKPFDLRQWRPLSTDGPAITDQIVVDSRRIDSPNALFVALPGSHCDGHDFVAHAEKMGARYAVVSKEWRPKTALKRLTLIPVDSPLHALQELASLYRQQMSCTVIAITGSFGKTMVKDLLSLMLVGKNPTAASPGSFNSQLGVPLSLLTIEDSHRFALIEAGVSQAGEMEILARTIAPDHAILTNIKTAYAPYFSDDGTTAAEKIRLLAAVKENGWSLLPESKQLAALSNGLRCHKHFWNRDENGLPKVRYITDQRSDRMLYEVFFPSGQDCVAEIRAGFNYCLENITIAIKAATLLGVSENSIKHVLETYTPEPMHTEIWKSPLGPTFFNDSYCADPLSVDLALQALHLGSKQGRRVFVFGGFRDKGAKTPTNFRRVGKAVRSANVDAVMLFGDDDFSALREEIATHAPAIPVTHWPHYEDVVNAMRRHLQPNDNILIKGSRKQSLDHLIAAWNDSPTDNKFVVDLAAIASNISHIRSRLPPRTRVMVMAKAAGYGTDAVSLAKYLGMSGVDILGVSYADEAVALKHAGASQELFVLNAGASEAAKIAKWGLQVGVSENTLLDALERVATADKPVKVHLHVDTGMSRFGCRPEEALALARRVQGSPKLILEGVMTHLASADDETAETFTAQQIATFRHVVTTLKKNGIEVPWIHAANSAGAIGLDLPECNMVRLGLAIYGLYPSASCRSRCDLRPALSLTSRIVGINTCKKGETVSYGRNYTVERDEERIAILPIGYFDGLHRHYSGKGHVIVRGQKAPMVGTICMDYMMINVTDIPNAAVGDSALVFGVDDHGQSLSAETLASQGQSVVHELITCLGPRLPRIFLYQ